MANTETITIRLSKDAKARLESEAKRQRMATGDVVTVAELLRRYAESLPEPEREQ
ncbi:hypothetical protein V5049_15865 [Moellerella wisconsensis]|uniref:hypothetical protein n=1 Tax=Moellerella wisconsensis TaxID=158849 RepID=UPI0030761534